MNLGAWGVYPHDGGDSAGCHAATLHATFCHYCYAQHFTDLACLSKRMSIRTAETTNSTTVYGTPNESKIIVQTVPDPYNSSERSCRVV